MTKSYKEIKRLKEGSDFQVQEACWDGYKQVGMKKKGDRMVPNCVKEEIVHAVFGKDYIHREPIMELTADVYDMYKGKLNKDQLATIKNTWKNRKQSDVTQPVKDMIRNFDPFTRMDIKQANIKYLSALINDEVQQEEVDFISPLQDQIEIVEMNSVVRKTELKEFTTDQINKLAKSYADMAGKTISLPNAQRLQKMFDRVPDSSLNALRKKKIPFLSGLALSRMIQKKIPVTESAYEDDEYAVSIAGIETERTERQELNEASPTIAKVKDIVKNQQAIKIDGTTVDLFTASAISQVYDKVNDVNKKRMDGMKIIPLANIAMKLLKNEYEHIELDEEVLNELGSKIPQLIGKVKAHMEMYKEMIDRVLKLQYGKKFTDTMLTITARTASKSVPDVIKELSARDLWKEQVEEQWGARTASGGKVGGKKFPKAHLKNEKEIDETDLTKPQVKQVHKQADELPKKDFIKRYGKDGDAIRYATATSQVKKKLGLGENRFKLKGELKMNESYKQRLDSAMGHLGINSLGELNPEEHKSFFAYVDNLKEGLSAAQKKLPPALQKAIAAKQGDKKETEEEELTPKQKQLDKDKDGDIGADDLAKLRATKKEDKKEVKENKRYLQTKAGSLEEAVLISRGLISEQRWEIEGKVGYKGIRGEDAFHMIINANSESDAEDKAYDELQKARSKRKIGPGGGGRVEDEEVESVQKTNKPLSAPETYEPGN